MIAPFSRTPRTILVLALWVTFGSLIMLVFLGSKSSIAYIGNPMRGDVGVPSTDDTPVAMEKHPIMTLIHKAEVDFAELLARQSRSFEAATTEYLRRYKRPTPPGFKIWYEFAVTHESPIIDEFDIINTSLAPFWSLSGVEVKRRLDNVRNNATSIWHCQSSSGQLQAGCECLGEELLGLLSDASISTHLPDVDILVNALDEPRVLSGGSDVEHHDNSGKPDWLDRSHQPVWDIITAGCHYNVASNAEQSSPAHDNFDGTGFDFPSTGSDALDLCRHPEYHRIHGLWRSPTSFQATHLTVPILSPAVPSTMGDIPFPAAAYSNKLYTYEELEDIPWENKTSGLYWTGKTTGSFQRAPGYNWKQDHRQRFVSLANNLSPHIHAYLERPNSSMIWQKRYSNSLNNSLYRVHFTDVVQCEDTDTCDAIRTYFKIHEPEPRSEGFKYTLSFDLDGNGHSGRYYRLLNSRSLPLKQTVFREWHDERLQPWYHYVPISLDMDELPEVVRYLADEEEGRQVAARLANSGREWSLSALRPIDQAIYMFRLMLELSRLQDPERSAS